MNTSTPDDLRELGWSVAVHNDYYVDGKRYTFWLMTKDGVAVKGEGQTDEDALTQIRVKVATRAQETPYEEKVAAWREVINKALWRQLKELSNAIDDCAMVGHQFPEAVKKENGRAYQLLVNTETSGKARDEAARQDQGDLRQEGQTTKREA